MEWKTNQKCDICKKEIGHNDYWDAVRQDGKRVAICVPCKEEAMTRMDPSSAPPFPTKTWSDNDN